MVSTADLQDVVASGERRMLFGVQLERSDLVEHKEGKAFDDVHYMANPHEYQNRFQRDIAPHLTALVNGMYWDARFPRLLSDEDVRRKGRKGRKERAWGCFSSSDGGSRRQRLFTKHFHQPLLLDEGAP